MPKSAPTLSSWRLVASSPSFSGPDSAAAAAESGPLKEGLEATSRQLLKVGADFGMTQIDPHGEAFDPAWHQAVSQVPGDGAAPGSVVQVFQKGYSLNDRLLRPALVAVASQ